MILIVIVAIVCSSSIYFELPAKLSAYSPFFHHFCLQMLPMSVENHSSLEALVCGKNMHEVELKQLLIQSSLIHIFIVSGSHFSFLHKILARFPIVRFCPLSVLSIYCLITLCQPPAVRALIFLSLVHFSKRQKHHRSSTLQVLLSCILTLCIFPQWISSRSLLMSLLAALTLAMMEDFWGKRSKNLSALFLTQSAVYLVMGFCLWGFSNLHPLGILLNLTLGPLIGGVIFPLALLVVFIPPLAFLFDAAMAALAWILQNTSEVLGPAGVAQTPSVVWQWILFLTLTLAAHFTFVTNKRRKARHV